MLFIRDHSHPCGFGCALSCVARPASVLATRVQTQVCHPFIRPSIRSFWLRLRFPFNLLFVHSSAHLFTSLCSYTFIISLIFHFLIHSFICSKAFVIHLFKLSLLFTQSFTRLVGRSLNYSYLLNFQSTHEIIHQFIHSLNFFLSSFIPFYFVHSLIHWCLSWTSKLKY